VHHFRDWYSRAAVDFGWYAALGGRIPALVGARREEGEYPLWSLTAEQQSTRPKSAQPFGLGRRRRLAALLAR